MTSVRTVSSGVGSSIVEVARRIATAPTATAVVAAVVEAAGADDPPPAAIVIALADRRIDEIEGGRTAVAMLPPILVLDPTAATVAWCGGGASMLVGCAGADPGELGNHHPTTDLFDLRVIERLRSVWSRGSAGLATTGTVRHEDGTVMQAEITAAPVLRGDARIGIAVVLLDAEEHARLRSYRADQQALAERGRRASTAAHDLNNLLTAVIGYVSIAIDNAPPHLTGDLLDLRDAAQRASALTRRMLASGPVAERLAPIDVASALVGMEPTLSVLAGRDVAVEVTRPTNPCTARIDPVELEQVVVNLVVNAVEAVAGARGSVAVDVREELFADGDGRGPASPGRYVVIDVADSGPGISADVAASIFEERTTTKGTGRGLGLSIVQGIVRRNGGAVWPTSGALGGTTMRVALPTATVERATRSSGDGANDEPGGAQPVVLIVEDEATIRGLLRRVVEGRGAQVVEAATGVQAIERAVGLDRVDVLVTDVVLPGLSGVEVARRLRGVHQGLQVIVVSGYPEQVADDLAGVAFVQKPFLLPDLVAAVEAALARSRCASSSG